MKNTLDKNTIILITGCGGVLGQAVLEYFRAQSFKCLLTPGREEMDLLDLSQVNAYFMKHRPEVVIHLAAKVFGLGGNLKYQMQSLTENTAINNNLFTALATYPAKQIFFAGTVASYPFSYDRPYLAEEYFFQGLPHGGEFGYSMAKKHAYPYLELLHKEVQTDFVYGIFTNLYGAHDRFNKSNGHVIPSLIAKAYEAVSANKPLEVWGDGLAQRDFLHAYDAARAILFCLENKSAERLINISTAQGVSIKTVAEIIAKEAGIEHIHYDINKPVGIPKRIVDNQKIINLGYSPAISLEEGLVMTYQWYKSNQGNIRR